MTTPVRLTPEQQEQLARTTAEVLAAVRDFTEAIAPALQAAAAQFRQLHEQLQAAFVLEPDTTPYESCICPATHAGLALCARCPGNTPKEPTT